MVGPYVAATIVTLVQFLRLRDRRLLLIAALFAFEAQALSREWFDPWKDLYQNAACLAGLALVVILTQRRPAAAPDETTPPREPERPAGGHEAEQRARTVAE